MFRGSFKNSNSIYNKNPQRRRMLLNIIFVSAFIILFIMGTLSFTQVQTLMSENNRIQDTYEVISTTNLALYEATDIESGQRAYLLTGKEYLLTEREVSKSKLDTYLNTLIKLTENYREQNERAKQLKQIVQKRMSQLNKVLQLKRSGQLKTEEGQEAFNRSQDLSSQVTGLGNEIKAVEYVLLKERSGAALKTSNLISIILIAGNIISLAALLIAFYLANKELSSRMKAENNSQIIQNRLRRIVESSAEMIAAFDEDKRFIMYNDAYKNEFNRLFHKSIFRLLPLNEALKEVPEDKEELSQLWKKSLESGEYKHTAHTQINGQAKVYEISSSQLYDEEQRLIGAVQNIADVTQRMKDRAALQRSNESLAMGMTALEAKNTQITMLVEMSDIMLACSKVAELTTVLSNFSSRILDFVSGYLYLMHPSKNYLEKSMSWGTPSEQDVTFTPEQCWAIRLGRTHRNEVQNQALVCNHLSLEEENESYTSICMPLMAQNDIYGLLYVETKDTTQDLLKDENKKLLLTAFSELIALALANVRLRENLRHQSIRDPLTGLYNRRYMEDFLIKQLNQAERTHASLAVLMLDLDHFKRVNDNYGHEAGDAVLKEAAEVLQNDIRAGDIAARYGGEEFLILLYNIDAENSKKRAEIIRKDIHSLKIKYGAEPISPITVSIGIALYPKDKQIPQELIDAADKALYFAKKKGRNQVVLFSEMNTDLKRDNKI